LILHQQQYKENQLYAESSIAIQSGLRPFNLDDEIVAEANNEREFMNVHYHDDPKHYQEMATIGDRFDGFNVRIYSDERNPIEPHFHVTKGSGPNFPFETCLCVRAPYYFAHTFKGQIIQEKLGKLKKGTLHRLNRFLSETNDLGYTHWEELLLRWNSDNPDSFHRLPLTLPQPDYSKLLGIVKEIGEGETPSGTGYLLSSHSGEKIKAKVVSKEDMPTNADFKFGERRKDGWKFFKTHSNEWYAYGGPAHEILYVQESTDEPPKGMSVLEWAMSDDEVVQEAATPVKTETFPFTHKGKPKEAIIITKERLMKIKDKTHRSERANPKGDGSYQLYSTPGRTDADCVWYALWSPTKTIEQQVLEHHAERLNAEMAGSVNPLAEMPDISRYEVSNLLRDDDEVIQEWYDNGNRIPITIRNNGQWLEPRLFNQNIPAYRDGQYNNGVPTFWFTIVPHPHHPKNEPIQTFGRTLSMYGFHSRYDTFDPVTKQTVQKPRPLVAGNVPDLQRIKPMSEEEFKHWDKCGALVSVQEQFGNREIYDFVELHWYEHPNVGMVDLKVKPQDGQSWPLPRRKKGV
jgi:hypothetical protein